MFPSNPIEYTVFKHLNGALAPKLASSTNQVLASLGTFAGGSAVVQAASPVHIFPQSQIAASTPRNGCPGHRTASAIGARDPAGVRHVRHQGEL